MYFISSHETYIIVKVFGLNLTKKNWKKNHIQTHRFQHCISLCRTLPRTYSLSVSHFQTKRSISFRVQRNSFELNFVSFFLSLPLVLSMCPHPSLALYMHPQFVCFCSCSRLPLCVEQTYSLSLVFRISFSHGDSIPLCVCTDLSVSVVLVGVWVCVGILYVTLAHFFLHIVQAKVKTVEIERAREREKRKTYTENTS